MRTWREVRNFASQKFRLTPGTFGFELIFMFSRLGGEQ